MKQTNGEYTDVVIIGNGFDLNLGFKTSYTDFIESEFFLDLVFSGFNELASYLIKHKNLKNWIDIEKELIQYSRISESSSSKFKSIENDYLSLCNSLISYLKSIQISKIDRDCHSYRLLENLKNKQFLILDYNYTSITKSVLEDIGLTAHDIEKRLIKIHGSIEEGNIIFGVQDEANINENHVFLRKGYPKHYKGINVDNELRQLKNLHIFGHSLGVTDHSYFKHFFELQSSNLNYKAGKSICLYHYGDSSYKALHMQLDVLTSNSLSSFKQINIFNAIDTSI